MSEPHWLSLFDSFTRTQAVYWLWKTYLFARAWGTDDFEHLDAADRTEFSEIVKAGEAFEIQESLKKACLAHGVRLPHRILAEIKMPSTSEPLPEESRERLGTYHHVLWPMMLASQMQEDLAKHRPRSDSKAKGKRKKLNNELLRP